MTENQNEQAMAPKAIHIGGSQLRELVSLKNETEKHAMGWRKISHKSGLEFSSNNETVITSSSATLLLLQLSIVHLIGSIRFETSGTASAAN